MSVVLLPFSLCFSPFFLFSGSCWLEGAQQEGGVSFVGCGLGGLDLAHAASALVVSALVVSAMRPRPWWSRPWWSRPCGLGLRGGLDLCGLGPGGLDLAVSASVVSTCAVSTSAASSRPLQSRPQRRCHIALCLLCFLVFSLLLHVNQHLLFPTGLTA
jgi:hypothetical protein